MQHYETAHNNYPLKKLRTNTIKDSIQTLQLLVSDLIKRMETLELKVLGYSNKHDQPDSVVNSSTTKLSVEDSLTEVPTDTFPVTVPMRKPREKLARVTTKST